MCVSLDIDKQSVQFAGDIESTICIYLFYCKSNILVSWIVLVSKKYASSCIGDVFKISSSIIVYTLKIKTTYIKRKSHYIEYRYSVLLYRHTYIRIIHQLSSLKVKINVAVISLPVSYFSFHHSTKVRVNKSPIWILIFSLSFYKEYAALLNPAECIEDDKMLLTR